jgi:hypothetical protein
MTNDFLESGVFRKSAEQWNRDRGFRLKRGGSEQFTLLFLLFKSRIDQAFTGLNGMVEAELFDP